MRGGLAPLDRGDNGGHRNRDQSSLRSTRRGNLRGPLFANMATASRWIRCPAAFFWGVYLPMSLVPLSAALLNCGSKITAGTSCTCGASTTMAPVTGVSTAIFRFLFHSLWPSVAPSYPRQLRLEPCTCADSSVSPSLRVWP
jgi:hypothetical protein